MTKKKEKPIVTTKTKEEKLKEREEKRAKVSKAYYDLPEEEIQDIILRVKDGDLEAKEKLLEVFRNFLEKYVTLLSTGYFDLRDYDIKQFLCLYLGDATLRDKVRKDKLNFKAYEEVDSVIGGIVFMVRRYNDEYDVRQTVNMTFVERVLKYKRMGAIPFSGYLYRNFFYSLKKNVDTLLIDQNGLHSFPLITDDSVGSSFEMGDPESTAGGIHEKPDFFAKGIEEMMDVESIDEYWVLGETCAFPFNQLTRHERQLIKWRYIDGLRPNKIAERTSDHPNTCRQHIKLVVERLRSIMLDGDFSL